MEIPGDPAMLFSYLNTKLRDDFPSLAAFCEDNDVEIADLLHRLEENGLGYDPSSNRVVWR